MLPLETSFLPEFGYALRIDPLAALEGVDKHERKHIERGDRQSFGAAVAGVGPPPCTRSCPWYARCKYERLACAAFSRYVKHGEACRVPGEVPTRARYERLYRD
jgi:hypothetical protein